MGFLDLTDLFLGYCQYLSLLLRVTPSPFIDWFVQPLLVLEVFSVNPSAAINRARDPLSSAEVRSLIPASLPIDRRLTFLLVAVLIPLVFSSFGVIFLSSKEFVCCYLCFLLAVLLITTGSLPNVLPDPLVKSASSSTTSASASSDQLIIFGCIAIVLAMIVGVCWLLRDALRTRKNEQTGTSEYVLVLQEPISRKLTLPHIMRNDTWQLDVFGQIIRLMLLAVSIYMSLACLRVTEIPFMTFFGRLGYIDYALAVVFLLFSVGGALWFVLNMFRSTREMLWKFSASASHILLNVSIILISSLTVPVSETAFAALNCVPSACPADYRLPDSSSSLVYYNSLVPRAYPSSAAFKNRTTINENEARLEPYCQPMDVVFYPSENSSSNVSYNRTQCPVNLAPLVQERLFMDRSVACTAAYRGYFFSAAAIMMLVVNVGTALLQITLTRDATAAIEHDFCLDARQCIGLSEEEMLLEKLAASTAVAGSIYGPFQREFRYWRCFAMVHKVLVVFAATVFFENGSSSAVSSTMLSMILSFLFHAVMCGALSMMQPYVRRVENYFAISCHAMLCVLCILGIAGSANDNQYFAHLPGLYAVVAALLIFVPLACFAVGMYLSYEDEEQQAAARAKRVQVSIEKAADDVDSGALVDDEDEDEENDTAGGGSGVGENNGAKEDEAKEGREPLFDVIESETGKLREREERHQRKGQPVGTILLSSIRSSISRGTVGGSDGDQDGGELSRSKRLTKSMRLRNLKQKLRTGNNNSSKPTSAASTPGVAAEPSNPLFADVGISTPRARPVFIGEEHGATPSRASSSSSSSSSSCSSSTASAVSTESSRERAHFSRLDEKERKILPLKVLVASAQRRRGTQIYNPLSPAAAAAAGVAVDFASSASFYLPPGTVNKNNRNNVSAAATTSRPQSSSGFIRPFGLNQRSSTNAVKASGSNVSSHSDQYSAGDASFQFSFHLGASPSPNRFAASIMRHDAKAAATAAATTTSTTPLSLVPKAKRDIWQARAVAAARIVKYNFGSSSIKKKITLTNKSSSPRGQHHDLQSPAKASTVSDASVLLCSTRTVGVSDASILMSSVNDDSINDAQRNAAVHRQHEAPTAIAHTAKDEDDRAAENEMFPVPVAQCPVLLENSDNKRRQPQPLRLTQAALHSQQMRHLWFFAINTVIDNVILASIALVLSEANAHFESGGTEEEWERPGPDTGDDAQVDSLHNNTNNARTNDNNAAQKKQTIQPERDDSGLLVEDVSNDDDGQASPPECAKQRTTSPACATKASPPGAQRAHGESQQPHCSSDVGAGAGAGKKQQPGSETTTTPPTRSISPVAQKKKKDGKNGGNYLYKSSYYSAAAAAARRQRAGFRKCLVGIISNQHGGGGGGSGVSLLPQQEQQQQQQQQQQEEGSAATSNLPRGLMSKDTRELIALQRALAAPILSEEDEVRIKKHVKDVYSKHLRQVQARNAATDYRTDRDTNLTLLLYFVGLSIAAFVALGLVAVGLSATQREDRTNFMPPNGVDESVLASQYGTAQLISASEYSLAGYKSWRSFTESCCCVAFDNQTDVQALTVEKWLCKNGRVKERARRTARGVNALRSVRGLCETEFLNNCSVFVTVTPHFVSLVGCNSNVTDEVKALW